MLRISALCLLASVVFLPSIAKAAPSPPSGLTREQALLLVETDITDQIEADALDRLGKRLLLLRSQRAIFTLYVKGLAGAHARKQLDEKGLDVLTDHVSKGLTATEASLFRVQFKNDIQKVSPPQADDSVAPLKSGQTISPNARNRKKFFPLESTP